MARVTVEDCMKVVSNRFELVILAAQRARDLYAGAERLIDESDDREPVIALREIAANKLDLDALRIAVVKNLTSSRYDKGFVATDFTSFDGLFANEIEEEGKKSKSTSNVTISGNIFADQNIDVED